MPGDLAGKPINNGYQGVPETLGLGRMGQITPVEVRESKPATAELGNETARHPSLQIMGQDNLQYQQVPVYELGSIEENYPRQ